MADRTEHLAGFDAIAELLRTAAAANARALAAERGGATEADVEGQLEHTLDRLAALYGRGTFEALSTLEIFETAIENEVRLASELRAAGAGTPVIAAAAARAQALVDAARRGVRLNVREVRGATMLRAVYLEHVPPEFELRLRQKREPYLGWRGGIVVMLAETEIAALRSTGDAVDVLFLDPDELLDLDARGDRTALEGELVRRLAVARAAPDRVGEPRDRQLRRLLLRHSTVLRNLRDRLAVDHPAAGAALRPILAEHRSLLESALLTAPAPLAALADPLTASIEHERALQTLVARWAAEPDDAGFAIRFDAVAAAGTRLASLERHRP